MTCVLILILFWVTIQICCTANPSTNNIPANVPVVRHGAHNRTKAKGTKVVRSNIDLEPVPPKPPMPTEIFKEFANKAHNDSRAAHVTATLRAAAGVYLDKKTQDKSFSKTVFISVAAFNTQSIAHYKVYFKNFLCFVKHYNIDMILYILHHDIHNLEDEIHSLEQLGVRVLTYPDELFWKLIASKTNALNLGKGHGDYNSSIPSFTSYGALVMLVPILEVLEYGYNVIYFDVDIALVYDPIPYMTQGTADFTSSIEMRHCPEFFTISKPETSWHTLEPNTGIMHIRSTPQGKKMFRMWLEKIVHDNVMNDQRAFVPKYLGAYYTSDCNGIHMKVNNTMIPDLHDANIRPTYCYLSEALFQNGMTAVQCSTNKFRGDWLVGMDLYGKVGPSMYTNNSTGGRYPLTVHVNYVKEKSTELNRRGLWLYNDSSTNTQLLCKPYKVEDTYFSKGFNFTGELESVRSVREELYLSANVNGTLVQRHGGAEVYMVDVDMSLRQIPNAKIFETLFGESSWKSIKILPTNIIERFKIGREFESVIVIP